MKTIKINNNSAPDDFKGTRLVRVKDVIELIDEKINSLNKKGIFGLGLEELNELKQMIEGK